MFEMPKQCRDDAINSYYVLTIPVRKSTVLKFDKAHVDVQPTSSHSVRFVHLG